MKSDLNPEAVAVRQATGEDLGAIAEIQELSPEAAHWNPADYLEYDCVVAVRENRVVGFAAARRVAEGENELLNLAVHPDFRRRGAGRRLVEEIIFRYRGEVWLEVRESNAAARKFYKKQGFCDAGSRPEYYQDSGEGAIVMNFHS